ncbi:MAG: GtrA family protein [Patescibacteria group bacterium]
MLKFLSFALIGLINSILDTTIWKILSNIFNKNQKITTFFKSIKLNNYSGAQIFAFIISVTSSFILNSTFTWKDSNPFSSPLKITLYFIVSIFTMILTVVFINFFTKDYFLVKFNKLISNYEERIHANSIIKKIVDYPLLVKLGSIALSMVSNYFGYNFVVFR